MSDDVTRTAPDPSAAVARAVLGTSRVFVEVGWLPRTPSTQLPLVERARAGHAGVVLATGHQSAGRGRLARAWVTPPGVALTFSILLDLDPVPATRWPWLPLLTGLALDDAVAVAGGLPDGVGHGLKWPNDLLVGRPGEERKAAGILAERVEVTGAARAVVGVGLNVTTTAADLPVPTATSLALEGARLSQAGGHAALLTAFLVAFETRLVPWREAGGDATSSGLLAEYRRRCLTLGRDVAVELPGGGRLAGRADDVDDSGRLVVTGPNGGRQALGAGDVVHVRVP